MEKYLYFAYSAAIGLLIYLIYKLIETRNFLNIVEKIPGPKPLPIVGNILDFQQPPEIIFKMLHEYFDVYGPIYRVNSGCYAGVFIKTPEDIEFFISGMKNLEKSQFYLCLHMWLESGLLTSTDDKWQTRRKILTPTFHFNILQQFCKTFIEQGEKLVNELEKLTSEPIDVVPLITKTTLHTICETAMGANMASKGSETYRKAVYKMGFLTIFRILRPWYYTRLTYLASPRFYETYFTSRFLHKYSQDIITERKRSFKALDMSKKDDDEVYRGKKKLAMLDMLLEAQAKGADITDVGIREEVDTFMFEGHDTTSSSISFTLMLLASNPDVQDKVVEELRAILPESTDQITYDALNQMKYLERVIKESLRLYPSVPMIGRMASETVQTPSGYTVPAGSDVLIRIYDLHMDANIYPNPKKFDPDRFLPENIAKRHPYAYLPFSAGPRNCIGQKFAFLELKTVIASILRKFVLVQVDTPETITLVTDLILHTKNGIKVHFKPRPSA